MNVATVPHLAWQKHETTSFRGNLIHILLRPLPRVLEVGLHGYMSVPGVYMRV